MGMLHHGGARMTARAEDAEILVVNTCSFIDSAKQESVDTILEMVQHKVAHGGRAQKLIVAGCLVERYRDEIMRNIPEVDAVVGTGELEGILEAAGLKKNVAGSAAFPILTTAQIERHASAVNQHSRPEGDAPQLVHEAARSHALDAQPQSSRPEGDAREAAGRFSRETWDGATAALPSYLYSDETPRILTTPRASAYIKIAEGCDHPCSFCIIPQLRGKFRSRPVGSIVAEARSLIAQGVREITLIGQDTTCYGEDLPKDAATGKRPELADLLDALAPIEGLKWLRFLYAYPNKVTTRLLESIAQHDNVAKYLDVPLQHASGNVLRRMKRGGSGDRFLQIIDKARKIVPGIVLRTVVHRWFSGGDGRRFRAALRVCRVREDRLAGRVQLLGRRGRGSLCARRESTEAHHRGAAEKADASAEQDQPQGTQSLGWARDRCAGRGRERGDRVAMAGTVPRNGARDRRQSADQ